jgi:hypothetical protein
VWKATFKEHNLTRQSKLGCTAEGLIRGTYNIYFSFGVQFVCQVAFIKFTLCDCRPVRRNHLEECIEMNPKEMVFRIWTGFV